jgi:UDP-N-acetylmuramate--alanine ligase
MTNADGDHFDFFKDESEYQNAFLKFISKLPFDGTVITHFSDPICAGIVQKSNKLYIDADKYPLPVLSTPGTHMKQNAQLVLALGTLLCIDSNKLLKSLKDYSGCWRRMEKKGFFRANIPVIDDYGHHPKEISATLTALKDEYASHRLVCIFQPHMHHRTIALYEAFCSSFKHADAVIIADVYDARSYIKRDMVNMNKFAADISDKSNVFCKAGGSLENIEKELKDFYLKKGDVLLCMGAGTITELADKMVIS